MLYPAIFNSTYVTLIAAISYLESIQKEPEIKDNVKLLTQLNKTIVHMKSAVSQWNITLQRLSANDLKKE